MAQKKQMFISFLIQKREHKGTKSAEDVLCIIKLYTGYYFFFINIFNFFILGLIFSANFSFGFVTHPKHQLPQHSPRARVLQCLGSQIPGKGKIPPTGKSATGKSATLGTQWRAD